MFSNVSILVAHKTTLGKYMSFRISFKSPMPRLSAWYNHAPDETRRQFAELTSGMPGKLERNEDGLFHLVTNRTYQTTIKDDNELIEENTNEATMSLCSKVAFTVFAVIALSIIGCLLICSSLSIIFNQL